MVMQKVGSTVLLMMKRNKSAGKGTLEANIGHLFAYNKRGTLSASVEEMTYKQNYQKNFQLLSTNTEKFCLSASPNWKRTSKEFPQGSFSPYRWDTNQLWKLNYNGTLVSRYSGLCASMYRVKDNAIPGGIRSWIATGRRGEILVALFNLSLDKMVISAKILDLSMALLETQTSPRVQAKKYGVEKSTEL